MNKKQNAYVIGFIVSVILIAVGFIGTLVAPIDRMPIHLLSVFVGMSGIGMAIGTASAILNDRKEE